MAGYTVKLSRQTDRLLFCFVYYLRLSRNRLSKSEYREIKSFLRYDLALCHRQFLLYCAQSQILFQRIVIFKTSGVER